MTTLIAWAAIDSRGTSGVYMASDSRLTWDTRGEWDAGRKIFASEKYPEILGYTGDALFCSQVLSQVIAFIDACAVLHNASSFMDKFCLVESLIKRAFNSYPKRFCLPAFSIVYLTRLQHKWASCTFSWDAKKGWADIVVHAVPHSHDDVIAAGVHLSKAFQHQAYERAVIFVSEGSGGNEFRTRYNESEWAKKLPLFSRGIFGAFCDFVSSSTKVDFRTGGTPQLSGLYRAHPAQKIGFVEGDQRYLYGITLDPAEFGSPVRWVNREFENCGSLTGNRNPGAQRQPAPY